MEKAQPAESYCEFDGYLLPFRLRVPDFFTDSNPHSNRERPAGSTSTENRPTVVSQPSHSSISVEEIRAQSNSDKYQPEAEIGRGGFGKIFRALEKPLRRKVALKVLLDSDNGEYQRRFIREARITGGMEHPSIVPIHELNVDPEGRIYYTMKLVKGISLQELLDRLAAGDEKILDEYRLTTLLTILQKVCDAVAFAHSQLPLVIHRDLKPSNIMIGDYGEVLVMDWGAAKLRAQPDGEHNSEDGGATKDLEAVPAKEMLLTKPGAVVGTPGYMAPEQVTGRSELADERTDIFALGGILYSMLTLNVPERVTSEHVEELLKNTDEKTVAGLFHQRVAPVLINPTGRPKLKHLPSKSVPDSLAAVALKAMAFDPRSRYQSVTELQADVTAYQAGRATAAEQAGIWKQLALLVARNKILFSAITIIFITLLGSTIISVRQRRAALASNQALRLTLQQASRADFDAAKQRFGTGVWREGIALLGRSLSFWPENREAANYLLSAIAFGRGDRDNLPIFGVHHDAAVFETSFSPDGRYFATASHDHTTKVWDVATGAQVGKTLHHDAPCDMPRFSPDGRRLVTTSEDGVVKLWETLTGKLLATMRHGRPDLDASSLVTSAIFSSDGNRLLTGSFDHTARVWDATTGKEIAQLVNPQRVSDALWSPDETRIVTPYWYGGAMIWDAAIFKPIGAPMQHAATVRRALFTPDGTKIVTSCLDKSARIWDGHTGKPLSPPLKHDDLVWDLDISPDGKLVATASYDKTVRLWSTADGTPVGVPMQHAGPVDTVAFSPNGKRLVTASRDKTVRLWDVATCKEIGNPMRHDETVMRAIFDPADATKLLSVGWDSAAYLWDAQPPSSPGEVIRIPGEIRSVEFIDKNDRLFVATRNGQAGIWSLHDAEFVTPVAYQNDAVSVACYHSGSAQIATASQDGTIRLWSDGKQTGATKPANDTIVALAFAPDGRSLFAAYLSGSVIQWKIPEGTQIGNAMRHSEKMDALAVSPSGREIATGCRDDFLYLWKPGENAPPHKIRHNNPVRAVTYSPDGRFIATGCDDNTARIWSLDSGKQLGEPFYLNGRPTTLHYTGDGNALLVGGITDTDVDYYDTKTHNNLYIPLPHSSGVSHVTSNADGSLVITLTNDGIARLWRIPSESAPPPKWLPDYLRAVGGLTFSDQQQLTQVPTRERLELRKKLLDRPPEDSIWDKLMRWSLKSRSTAAFDPSLKAGLGKAGAN